MGPVVSPASARKGSRFNVIIWYSMCFVADYTTILLFDLIARRGCLCSSRGLIKHGGNRRNPGPIPQK